MEKVIEERYEKTVKAVKDISLCIQELKKVHDSIESPIIRETTKSMLDHLKEEKEAFTEELEQIDHDLKQHEK